MSQHRILVVDDDVQLLRLLSMRLRASGYEVATAENGKEGLGKVAAFRPHVVITDLRMNGMDGMTLFDLVHTKHPTLPVIILTAYGTIPDAVHATQRGSSAYFTKPFDSQSLLECVSRLVRVQGEVSSVDQSGADAQWRREIVSRSRTVEDLLVQAARVARSETNVLIQGESGTGKELLARAIHRASPRSEGAFMPVNCTAMPEALLESELFGHTKGAFTGATHSRKGLFQAAHRGTLLLDEIGDMRLTTQAKLLRALEDGEIRPVGAIGPVSVDVRIISATHRNLEDALEAGEFREDLYYRLNVVKLEMPPLSKRREDIPLLAQHFLADIRDRGGEQVRGFTTEAMERLMAAPWPGNVRQLRNVIEQCAVLCTGSLVSETLVEKALRGRPGDLPTFAEARDRFEFDYLVRLLEITEGNVAQAARLADRNRSEFYKLLRRHHLQPGVFRTRSEQA